MTQLERHYNVLLHRLAHEYSMAAASGEWHRFRNRLTEVFRWADMVAAAKVRHQTLDKRTTISASNIDDVIDENPWLIGHTALTQSNIEECAKFVVASESSFWKKRGQFLATKAAQGWAAWRLGMIHRLGIGDVVSTAQQIQISDPMVRSNIAFIKYRSVCKKTSRPSHCAMNRFLAVPEHPIWKEIRPPNGYGCLCSTEIVLLDDAKRAGWFKGGRPRFTIRWPNQGAKIAYRSGMFPDVGWGSERNRIVAFA